MKFLKRAPKEHSYVLIKTKNGESIQGVMSGKALTLDKIVKSAKRRGLLGIEVGTMEDVFECIPFDDIEDFTAAPYDGPHWWEDA